MKAELKVSANDQGKSIIKTLKSSIDGGSIDHIPYFDLGIIKYNDSYQLQLEIFEIVKEKPVAGVLLLLEHYPVITIGNNRNLKNLISSESLLKKRKIELVQSNRGGDVTFHGPGQLVCYPIFDLQRFEKDLGRFVFNLEEIVINTLDRYGVKSCRINGIRGVFVNNSKIASIGLHVKKWVTLHGFSFNINVDLSYFENIVACGLKDYRQTSLQKILDKKIPIIDVKELVLQNFKKVFDIRLWN